MNILSITNHFESSVALLSSSRIYASSEERFTRNKNQGGFPYKSIEWVLKESKINLKQCDKIIYCSCESIYPNKKQASRIIEDLLQTNDSYHRDVILHRALTETVYNSKVIEEFSNWVLDNEINKEKILYLDHHEAHAKSVLTFYQIEDAIVFTCDGKGGFTSSAVWDCDNGNLEQRNFTGSHNSLGYLYGNFTISLGYKAERHEGKLTGLAAFAEPPENFNKLNPFYIEHGIIKTKDIFGKYIPFFNRESNTWLNFDEFNTIIENWSPEQTASAAQKILEETILEWISQNLASSSKKICLSGGVFANVKLNQRIREKFPKNIVYVNPFMGDLGLVIGGLYENKKNITNKLEPYLGPSFDGINPSKFIDENKHKIVELDNINDTVRYLIRLFKVKSPVGLFYGKSEFGPRALGHRSIIFPATDKSSNNWLNERMNRSDFMPFAPIILDEFARLHLIGYEDNQITADFMTITYKCSEEFKLKAPAVVHVDGTARPQVLKREQDPWLYDLILEYCKVTGELCLMNTSFNNHEEPIVCSPTDAINSLSKKNIDAILYDKKFLISFK